MPGSKAAPTLTAKQRRFVAEYLVDLNATQAAIRAGYSAKTAGSVGNENLSKPEISAAVQKALDARQRRTEITADRVLRELAAVAFVDPRSIFNEDGNLRPITEWDDDTARALAGCDVTEEFDGRGEERKQVGWTKKVKFWNKVQALELLGKHLALFRDRVEHSGPDGGPIEVDDVRQRLAGRIAGIAARRSAGAGAGEADRG